MLLSANNTILSRFLFCSLIIDSYIYTNPAVIARIFNPITELALPIAIPRKEAKRRNLNTSNNGRG